MEPQVQIFDAEAEFQQSASTGARFANYVIDLIVFCAFFYGLMFVLGIVLGLTGLADSYVDFMQ